MLINFLVRTLQYYTEFLDFACFAHENMKKAPFKVGYLREFEEVFNTALDHYGCFLGFFPKKYFKTNLNFRYQQVRNQKK